MEREEKVVQRRDDLKQMSQILMKVLMCTYTLYLHALCSSIILGPDFLQISCSTCSYASYYKIKITANDTFYLTFSLKLLYIIFLFNHLARNIQLLYNTFTDKMHHSPESIHQEDQGETSA